MEHSTEDPIQIVIVKADIGWKITIMTRSKVLDSEQLDGNDALEFIESYMNNLVCP